MMGNGEDRRKSAAVSKSSAGIKASGIRASEKCETQGGGVSLNEFSETPFGPLSRSRRAPGRGEVADQIGLGLRNVYDDVLSQPVPDRFFDLLRQLEGVSGAPQMKKDAP